MVSFLALYRGSSVASAELVAVSTDPDLVGRYANDLLHNPDLEERTTDPALREILEGRRRALELVRDEGKRPR